MSAQEVEEKGYLDPFKIKKPFDYITRACDLDPAQAHSIPAALMSLRITDTLEV